MSDDDPGGDFQRYLAAKRTVDDRALDRRLLDRLREGLADRAAARDGPLRVLEVGAGVGTMTERLVDRAVLPPGETVYTAVDVEAANVERLRDDLGEWAAGSPRGHARPTEHDGGADGTARSIRYDDGDRAVAVTGVTAEATAFVDDADREWDLLVGAALLDILPTADLVALLGALADGGWWYFPITFDGGTRFRPPHRADRAVERAFHRHMDEKPGGSSRAGGESLQTLRSTAGVTVDAVAGSDWVVRPTAEDGYPADEAYFLGYVLDIMTGSVTEVDRPDLADETVADWLSTRRSQLDAGELVYLTHQLDLLGRVDGS